MWHVIPTILYIACVQAHHRLPYNPYIPHEYAKHMPGYTPYQGQTFSQLYHVAQKPYDDYTSLPISTYTFGLPGSSQFIEEYYPKSGLTSLPYYLRSENLRQSQSSPKSSFFQAYPSLDLDYSSSNSGNDAILSDMDLDSKGHSDTTSYFEDLELVENFGNYLKRRTQIDTNTITDSAHQYNALLAVLMALARTVRNSCADFDKVYDQVYFPTVETYYSYGLANADKVSNIIEDYIRKGNARMPKIRKLKLEACDETLCAASFDNKIKSSPLPYIKELEILEAIAHLARSYYPYIDEFNVAAQKGIMLQYLQRSKERLREYIMHVVNSVEHLADKPVKCT